jgi:small subunit ribosomal protein S20
MRYQWEKPLGNGGGEFRKRGISPFAKSAQGSPKKRKTHKLPVEKQFIINNLNLKMANHKSSLKRIRQDKVRNLHNRYYAKTMRNAVRKLRATKDKDEAVKMYPLVQKMLDKLAKVHIIHKNKAANLKSSLSLHIKKLG